MPGKIQLRRTLLPPALVAALLLVCCLRTGTVRAAGPGVTLCNDAYVVQPQADGALHIFAAGSREPAVFRPEFVALFHDRPLASRPVKWQQPVYNLVGWKLDDGRTVQDLFQAGERVTLTQPVVSRLDETVRWRFTHERIDARGGVFAAGRPIRPASALSRDHETTRLLLHCV